LIGGEDGAAGCGVVSQAVGEGWCDGLPADGAAFLVEFDSAAVGVEVLEPDGECAASSAGCLGVQAEQQGVEDGVVPANASDSVDLVECPGR